MANVPPDKGGGQQGLYPNALPFRALDNEDSAMVYRSLHNFPMPLLIKFDARSFSQARYANENANAVAVPSQHSGTKRKAGHLSIDTTARPIARAALSGRSPLPAVTQRPQSGTPYDLGFGGAPLYDDDTEASAFNLLKAMLRHENLFFQLAMRLSPQSFLDLYAIDKEFHWRLNHYKHSLLHDYAVYHVPDAAFVFPARLFPELCISDPLLKPMDARSHLARDIPSFRWVKMVLFRESVVKQILTYLALEGLRVPARTKIVLMKFWLLMEARTNRLRGAYVQDRDVWSDDEIKMFFLFLVKLDMRFGDPVQGQGGCELSRLLLMQRSLRELRDVLCGKSKVQDDYELDCMIARTYLPSEIDPEEIPDLEEEFGLGIPADEIGILRHEKWEPDQPVLTPAIEFLEQEALERKLWVHEMLPDFLMYGYVDERGQQVPRVRKGVGDKDFALDHDFSRDKGRRMQDMKKYVRAFYPARLEVSHLMGMDPRRTLAPRHPW